MRGPVGAGIPVMSQARRPAKGDEMDDTVHATDDDFDEQVLQSALPVLVDFYSPG